MEDFFGSLSLSLGLSEHDIRQPCLFSSIYLSSSLLRVGMDLRSRTTLELKGTFSSIFGDIGKSFQLTYLKNFLRNAA